MDDGSPVHRYYLDLAAAFVRGTLGKPFAAGSDAAVSAGVAAGLALHNFKRTETLPRVQGVIGMLRSLAPADLVDVGSGRGVFLWPLLDAFPSLRVTAVDANALRAGTLGAVSRGGVERLTAARMDAQQLALANGAADGVTLLEVLEHLPAPERAAAEAMRVARRFVIVSVPSRPDDNPEHRHLFDRARLEAMLRGSGARRVTVDYVLNHAIALAQV